MSNWWSFSHWYPNYISSSHREGLWVPDTEALGYYRHVDIYVVNMDIYVTFMSPSIYIDKVEEEKDKSSSKTLGREGMGHK